MTHFLVPVAKEKDGEISGEVSRWMWVQCLKRGVAIIATHEKVGLLKKQCRRFGIVPIVLELGEEF